jgi:hypothetical protein
MKKLLFLSVFLVMFSGCAISRSVTPVDSTASIRKIYVLNNEKVHMKELVNEVVDQLEELGFEYEAYSGDRPQDALHYLTYTGNWNWDMAMYLTYFRATLYEDGRVLGEVEYDAKMGGANMKKFGKTAEKIRPLMTELLEKVKRPVGDDS